LESAGFALLPLPRYSPDLSPIELCWSKLKTPLRTAEPRSIAAIEEQIVPALDTITPRMPRAGFAIAGILYQTNPKAALTAVMKIAIITAASTSRRAGSASVEGCASSFCRTVS